jgi:NAD(P)-dependent dehydrogenase (short-subunit alcohol dehydrogenase family)
MEVADQAGSGHTKADITGRVPMGRFASPDDIARAMAFLADDASAFINGHALAVDGGSAPDGSWESLRLRHR